MKKHYLSIFVLLIALFSSSHLIRCASLEFEGTEFNYIKKIPDGKGVIYFYRHKQFAGSFVSYDLWLEGTNEPFTHIYNGGYYPYFANPGKAVFFAKRTGSPMGLVTEKKEESVTIDVKAGESYYVWSSVKGG